jgi:protein NrfD
VLRETQVHWTWLVYLEMFLAGTAAGAYLTASLLELLGRGRSAVARTAHLLAFPLMAVAGLLLIVDLQRPERFWHMVLQSERAPLPMVKWWSPMSAGSWAVLLFNGFAFVSFLDALVQAGWLRLAFWRRRLHGSPAGLVWSLLGGAAACFVAAYSGVLLSVTNIPGWRDAPLAGALFVAVSAATGMAALLLAGAARGAAAGDERTAAAGDEIALERANSLALVWQLVLLGALLATAGGAARVFLQGLPLAALAAAVVLALLALGLRLTRRRPSAPAVALAATLVLAGGFLTRYAIVMGPQHG